MNERYITLKPIILGFLTPQDQYDASFDSGTILEADEKHHTIWVVLEDGTKKESITVGYAIDIWLEDGKIQRYER